MESDYPIDNFDKASLIPQRSILAPIDFLRRIVFALNSTASMTLHGAKNIEIAHFFNVTDRYRSG